MNRRLLAQASVALVLFAVWTSIVRVDISNGSRDHVWIDRRFGDWPEEVHEVRGTSDILLSIFATLASGNGTTGAPGAIPDMFGHPVIGTAIDPDDSENINGSRFTTGIRAGTLSSISAFVAGPIDEAPHDQFQLAIYDDSNGAPSHLLAATPSGRLVPNAWNTLAIRAVLQPTTSYWLMYNTNGTSGAVNNLTYTPVGGSPLDNAILHSSIRSHRTARFVEHGDRVTAAGDMTPMAVAIVIISLVAARRRPRAGIALAAGFAVALLIGWVLREWFFDPYGTYPSGHALRAAYVASAFCFVATWRGARLVAGLFVALISVAAVYSGFHYSEEVIGGLLLGWAIATAAKSVAGASAGSAVDPVARIDPLDPQIDLPDVVDLTDGSARRSRSEDDVRPMTE